MLKLSSSLSIKCSNCNCVNTYSPEDFELETSADSRNMGSEIHHSWTIDAQCNSCNDDISVSVEGWEYPIGVLNYTDQSVIGGDIISGTAKVVVKYDE